MRLDVFLADNAYYKSRTRAVGAIKAGCVFVGGKAVTKPSYELSEEEQGQISCLPDPLEYVGRGALKLDHALEQFRISVEGLECIDVGASTGGFTQVLLRRGASHVTAVDVGHGQLDKTLAADPRVTDLEGTDVRDFDPPAHFDFLSMDVSFISVTMLAAKIAELLKPGGNAVILFKPQFEVGRKFIGKGGIVRSKEASAAAMDNVVRAFVSNGFVFKGCVDSPIAGGDGNREALLWLVKPECE